MSSAALTEPRGILHRHFHFVFKFLRGQQRYALLVAQYDEPRPARESEFIPRALGYHYLASVVYRDGTPDVFSLRGGRYGADTLGCLGLDETVDSDAVHRRQHTAFLYVRYCGAALPLRVCLAGDIYPLRYLLL